MQDKPKSEIIADASATNWVDRYAPKAIHPYAKMARWDRPLPMGMLFWPCAMSLALAAVARPATGFNFYYLLLFFVGSFVMRGAGCTLNDIVDRNIDGKVERTKLRPIPSGQISVPQAFVFLAVQCSVGLIILWQFNDFTKILGLSSIGLVIIYPFMKRITYWPQLFLGLAFNWGALMGWAAMFGELHYPAFYLYAGGILWTIGYDTIYALQDREDDALIGVKSTARLFGDHAQLICGLFYLGAAILWFLAADGAGAGPVYYWVMWVAPAILAWQILTLKPDQTPNCLIRFKSNYWVGLSFTLALYIEYAI
ncbi:4-hydroxybenzoate octaprenyltransferase [Maritalea sp. S77]|uniref:4-hydroxybenzoate octaprenyltransferase n=1 Tax=Maritalea sp. S77 TaxID=3415125 RepID=UPI003C7992C8